MVVEFLGTQVVGKMGFHWQLSESLARSPGVMRNEPWTVVLKG